MYSIYYWPLFLTSHSCTFSTLKLVKLFKHWPYFSIAFQCVVSSGMSFPKLFICQTSSSSLNVSLCFTFFASPQYYSGYQFMCSKSILCILLPLHLLLCCDDELIIFVLQQNVYWTEQETFLSPVMSTLNKFLLNARLLNECPREQWSLLPTYERETVIPLYWTVASTVLLKVQKWRFKVHSQVCFRVLKNAGFLLPHVPEENEVVVVASFHENFLF